MPKDASWDAASGKFSWAEGELAVPPGFSYLPDWGTDTFVGRFTSRDGQVVISHDIGRHADTWARRDQQAIAFRETVVDGARVWVVRRDLSGGPAGRVSNFAVTFPDSGCANFYMESARPEDGQAIEFMARSFRPKGHRAAGCAGLGQ
ncbi:hypothetical protein [Paludibaculum fermentans]|uniref:Uncharacterized protein n=1 Tax=Paludibaculum fermentans TaxID=1473598 RepID=A0A7S7NVB9_PALFE|nr:hypothetical protein [Paludibaculum fermentans]QOY90466.1 hypothetical protein IRI77_11080 [Paludibaculum fermentans]